MKTLSRIIVVSFLFCAVTFGGNPNAPAKNKEFFETTKIPVVDYVEVPLGACLSVMACQAAELDQELDAKKKGFKFSPVKKQLENIEINYQAKNITFTKLLTEVGKQAKLDVYITSEGVIFCEPGIAPFKKDSKSKVWKVVYLVTKPTLK
jgi:hypothetical protein